MSEAFYQFKINQLNGQEIALSDFKGKAVLIVNTASKCGFTYQYKGLEKLYKDYQDSGLVVIGFPVKTSSFAFAIPTIRINL